MSRGNPPDEELRRIYAEAKTIAVVGASNDPTRHSHSVPAYLQSQGYHIIPVNGGGGEIFGVRALESLSDVDEPVDIVDIFRSPAAAPGITNEAVAIGAKVVWLQQGIVSEEARRIADENDLVFVEDICIGATHALLGLAE
jgi:hypothetical protein